MLGNDYMFISIREGSGSNPGSTAFKIMWSGVMVAHFEQQPCDAQGILVPLFVIAFLGFIMSNLKEKLEHVGISVDPFKRGPAGKDAFIISRQGNKIRFWEGNADISVKTAKNQRQALINVVERPRTIKATSKIHNYGYQSGDEDKVLRKYTKAEIRSYASTQVPNARMKIIKVNISDFRIVFDLEFRTQKTQTSFLVGFDENESTVPFICQLKNFVDNIKGAHEDLLPTDIELKAGYKRQGEWFFNPVDSDLVEELNKKSKRDLKIRGLTNQARYSRPISAYYRWEPKPTHTAATVKYKNKLYAIGPVNDTRMSHHEPLLLKGWYEVIRNNEVEVSTNNTSWD